MKMTNGVTCGLIAALLIVGAGSRAAPVRDEVRAYRAAHEKQIVTDFMTLLAMPDVATTVPDVDKNAAYIQGLLEARGFSTRLLRAEPATTGCSRRICLDSPECVKSCVEVHTWQPTCRLIRRSLSAPLK